MSAGPGPPFTSVSAEWGEAMVLPGKDWLNQLLSSITVAMATAFAIEYHPPSQLAVRPVYELRGRPAAPPGNGLCLWGGFPCWEQVMSPGTLVKKTLHWITVASPNLLWRDGTGKKVANMHNQANDFGEGPQGDAAGLRAGWTHRGGGGVSV